MRITIDERIGDDGASVITELARDDETIRVVDDGRVVGELSCETIRAVMNRYAKALDDGIALCGPSLDLGEDRRLVMLRHRARYDVIARDFLVFVTKDEEPRAALSTTIAAALIHLARAAERIARA